MKPELINLVNIMNRARQHAQETDLEDYFKRADLVAWHGKEIDGLNSVETAAWLAGFHATIARRAWDLYKSRGQT